jgi:hypothetical protein
MGNKNDGFKCDHLKSKCCNQPIRFEPKSDGYSLDAWCSNCANYVFTGRTESLICLVLGDLDAYKKNKGFIPKWIEEIKNPKKIKKDISDLSLVFNKIGDIVYQEEYIFYCSNCDKRYDFGIFYLDYPNIPTCKNCNKDMEIKKASFRIVIPHPRKGGW